MASVSIQQKASDSSASRRTSTNLSFSTPTAGNLLIVIISAYYTGSGDQYDFTLPSGWTRFANAYDSDPNIGQAGPQVFTRVADGTETSVTFSRTANSFISSAFFEVGGPTSGAVVDAYSIPADSPDGSGTIDLYPTTPTVANTLAIAACAFHGDNVAPSFSVSSGWTQETAATSNVYYQLITASQAQVSTIAAVTGSMTQSTTGSDARGGATTLLLRPGDSKTLTTVPTVSVTDRTARIGFANNSAADVSIKYSTNSDLSSAITTAPLSVTSNSDFAGHIDLSGLSSDTTYYYTPVISGVDQIEAPYAQFKTFPTRGTGTVFKFAFGSCTKHSDTIGEDSIFSALPSDARFFLHLGDLIYADRDPPTGSTLSVYRTQHKAALAGDDTTTKNWAALRAKTPVFTTWDDHDLANDYAAGTGSTLYPNAKQAMQEYSAQANPDPVTAGELYYTIQYGDVGFFVTDGRSFRSGESAADNASKTLLGATQKAALKNWLLTNKNTLAIKFICSSTPACGYGANTGGDSWGGVDDGTQEPNGANGYRTERNELWDFIDNNEIPGVVIVSGDQHWAGSFKTSYSNRPRYEFLATPLNMTNTSSFMLPAVSRAADAVNGPVLWKKDNTNNAGVVTVDTTVFPATVSYQLYDSSGSLGSSYLTSIDRDDIDKDLVATNSSNGAVSFDGTGANYYRSTNPAPGLPYNSAWSILRWVKITQDAGGFQSIDGLYKTSNVGEYGDIGFYIRGYDTYAPQAGIWEQKILAENGSNGHIDSSKFGDDSVWRLVVVSNDGTGKISMRTCEENGATAAQGSRTFPSDITTSGAHNGVIWLGGSDVASAQAVCSLSQYAIVDKNLTDAQIESLAAGATIDSIATPLIWYKLADANDLVDYGSEGNNLIATGSPTTVGGPGVLASSVTVTRAMSYLSRASVSRPTGFRSLAQILQGTGWRSEQLGMTSAAVAWRARTRTSRETEYLVFASQSQAAAFMALNDVERAIAYASLANTPLQTQPIGWRSLTNDQQTISWASIDVSRQPVAWRLIGEPLEPVVIIHVATRQFIVPVEPVR